MLIRVCGICKREHGVKQRRFKVGTYMDPNEGTKDAFESVDLCAEHWAEVLEEMVFEYIPKQCPQLSMERVGKEMKRLVDVRKRGIRRGKGV